MTMGEKHVEAGMELPSLSNAAEKVREHREVFAIAGLPGAGKSTVSDLLVEKMHEQYTEKVEAFEVSDYVRSVYESHDHSDEVNDNELGEWAAGVKRGRGSGVFVRNMAQSINWPLVPHLAISGLRSPAGVEALEDVFGDVTTIAVYTYPDIRFERKHGTRLSGEHFGWDSWVERNERELHDWNCVDVFTDEADIVLPNNDDIGHLEERVGAVVRHVMDDEPLPEGVRSAFPFDDPERAAQYL
jgi:dephospho-CoA kinase